jgi:hypothetical protein
MIQPHDTKGFSLNRATIVGCATYLQWRLYKRLFRRPNRMNHYKLESRLVCCISTTAEHDLSVAGHGSHRPGRAMFHIPCHLVSLHHHDPRSYRANKRSMLDRAARLNHVVDVIAAYTA